MKFPPTKLNIFHLVSFIRRNKLAFSMALHPSLTSFQFTRQLPLPYPRVFASPCLPVQIRATEKSSAQITVRRSGNYHPSIWQHEKIQMLRSDFMGDSYVKQINKMKEEVRMMLKRIADPLEQLEVIDILERLAISYYFEAEINKILEGIYKNTNCDDKCKENDLYAIALEFRLMRQHGYYTPEEIFNSFKDEIGNIKACVSEDIMGMLSLYEASYLSIDGENFLEEARKFTIKHLQEYVKCSEDEQNCALVSHALELPLHWRVPNLDARWFIDVYERRKDMNPILLELAKLDFNMAQSMHQDDLKYGSSWWKSTGLGEKLSFARDRVMANFLWTLGMGFEPQFGSYSRRMSIKVNSLLTIIDDMYDVYGTLDELQLFTNAVERWDISAMDELPDYMKPCFLALLNTVNEFASDVLEEQGVDVHQHLKKPWIDVCNSYLLEAKWYYSNYTPTLQEFMENGWISVAGPVMLVNAYVFATRPIREETLTTVIQYPDIIRLSTTILRLADDLGTSSHELQRGDVPKSIQCYMHETGASEDEARRHILYLIGETWKKLNEEVRSNSHYFPQNFVKNATNLARMSQYMYQYGDGHGDEVLRENKDRVMSLLVHPIPVQIRKP